jgi:hypothetical protein
VAGVDVEGLLCWGGELDLATLAATLHAHFPEYMCDDLGCVGCCGRGGTSVRGTREAEYEVMDVTRRSDMFENYVCLRDVLRRKENLHVGQRLNYSNWYLEGCYLSILK